MRVMMIGPYPRSMERVDGGVAAAITYLSRALVAEQGVELIGVRIARDDRGSRQQGEFDWPIVDLRLGAFGLSTLYRLQMHRFRKLVKQFRPDIVHGQGVDLPGYFAVGSGVPAVVTVHGILGEETKYRTHPTQSVRNAVL